jgi:hypothetical protein
MNQPARPDSFDDLLAEVTTFMEVQRLHLIGFLSEVALADIFAIARLAVFQTHYIECLFIRGRGARRLDFP